MLPRRLRAVFGEIRDGKTTFYLEGGGVLVVPRSVTCFQPGAAVNISFAEAMTEETIRARIKAWERRRLW